MVKKKVFTRLSDAKQQEYTRLARLQYDPQIVNQSVKKWNGYSDDQRNAIIAEGNRIYAEIVTALEKGEPATSDDVQRLFQSWHEHIRFFYEPTTEILRGLGELYVTNPDFRANFERLHQALPEYLQAGINEYVDTLENEELRRMLDDDQAQQNG